MAASGALKTAGGLLAAGAAVFGGQVRHTRRSSMFSLRGPLGFNQGRAYRHTIKSGQQSRNVKYIGGNLQTTHVSFKRVKLALVSRKSRQKSCLSSAMSKNGSESAAAALLSQILHWLTCTSALALLMSMSQR